MPEDSIIDLTDVRPGLLSPRLRMGAAILVGAVLVLGLFFFVLRDSRAGSQAVASGVCVCPDCGTTIPRPAGLDCEEMNCPNCGHSMTGAALLAATPGPMTQNQRETLAEQGIGVPRGIHGARGAGRAPRLAAADALPPMGNTGYCVCPGCGRRLARQPGVSCSRMSCPTCGSPMTNAVLIGRAPVPAEPDGMMLAGARGTGACPGTGGGGAGHVNAPPCRGAAGGNQGTTYSNTVRGIIAKNCLRCHGGPIRNMNTYDQVKAYADNGLIMMMIQPGGPMSRFLSADESHRISSWIKAGAPP